MVCCVSVSPRKRWPMNRKTVAMMAGNTARVGIRAITRAMVAATSRTRKMASSRISPVRKTTTIASTITTARINVRTMTRGRTVQRRISTAGCDRRYPCRRCLPLTCQSSPGPTPCARPSSRSAVTTRISRVATITTSAGMATQSHRPMTITGRGARVDTVTAGDLVPGIAPAK
ncbi:hypothetical protein D3C81_1653460 [compost metagenome]